MHTQLSISFCYLLHVLFASWSNPPQWLLTGGLTVCNSELLFCSVIYMIGSVMQQTESRTMEYKTGGGRYPLTTLREVQKANLRLEKVMQLNMYGRRDHTVQSLS